MNCGVWGKKMKDEEDKIVERKLLIKMAFRYYYWVNLV